MTSDEGKVHAVRDSRNTRLPSAVVANFGVFGLEKFLVGPDSHFNNRIPVRPSALAPSFRNGSDPDSDSEDGNQPIVRPSALATPLANVEIPRTMAPTTFLYLSTPHTSSQAVTDLVLQEWCPLGALAGPQSGDVFGALEWHSRRRPACYIRPIRI